MAYSQKGNSGYNSTRDEPEETHMDYQGSTMNPVLEPVTPPASSHQNSLYSHYFLSHHKPMTSKTQQSPGLITRDLNGTPYGYNTNTPMLLASPVDTPLSAAFNAKHQQQQLQHQSQPTYLATPHTPMSTSSLDSGSLPSTPSTSRPLSMTSVRHSTSANSTSPFPGVGPLGHSRSYSYNIRDQQKSLSRMSISGPTNTNSNGQDRQFRPRAYSSGLTGAPPISVSGSSNHSPVAKQSSELSVSNSAFPPPLSSPISPENMLPSNGRVNQRHHYTNSLTPTGDETHFGHSRSGSHGNVSEHLPRRGLTRSMSAVSSMNSPSVLHQTASMGQMAHRFSSDDFSDGYIFSNPLPTPNLGSVRRASPPSSRGQRQRRSSSGASSMSTINFALTPIDDLSYEVDFSGKSLSLNIDIASADDQDVYSLCRDQRGCRYLQRKLSERDPSLVRKVFNATHPHIVSLMMDPFGNYLCQKLFEYCSADDITELLKAASPSLPTIAINQHGTRALQKLIDAVTLREQVQILVEALDGHVVRLIRDLNGNHVIQKLLLDLDADGSQFIYDAVCRSVVEIGSHRHGCCVLQRCLDYAQEHNRKYLVAHIVAKALTLVCDPFGNYVCQYVIDLGIQEYTDSLVEQLLGKLASLSVQKFSSNVVEKCLRSASVDLQRAMIAEIMASKTLNELLLDNYGNYVIQTALESSSSLDVTTKHQLSLSIQAALAITRSPYGRRVMSKLKSW